MSTPDTAKMTSAEYLAREHAADSRSEFVNGRVLAMSGASLPHNLISGNIHEHLGPLLRRNGCRGFSHDCRVHVASQDSYFYPDFVAVCGTFQMQVGPTDTLLNPTLIIEILSPSTEAYDRGAKFFHYQQIPSLQQYVLVTQQHPLIEVFTRQVDGRWLYDSFSNLESVAALGSVNLLLPLSVAYAEVSFAD